MSRFIFTKFEFRTRLVKVIQGQGQEKFHLALIGFKLDGNKPGCERSVQWTFRMTLVKVIWGQGQVNFNLLRLSSNLVRINLDVRGVWNITSRITFCQGHPRSKSGEVKCKLALIGLKLGKNKPTCTCNSVWKLTLTRSSKVKVRGSGQFSTYTKWVQIW